MGIEGNLSNCAYGIHLLTDLLFKNKLTAIYFCCA